MTLTIIHNELTPTSSYWWNRQPTGSWYSAKSLKSGEKLLIYKGFRQGYLVLYEMTKYPYETNTPWLLYYDVKKLSKGDSFVLSYTI